MKTETPTQTARSICPGWMLPTGYAHYRDVLKALQEQRHAGMLAAAEICDKVKHCEAHVAAKHIRDAVTLNDPSSATASAARVERTARSRIPATPERTAQRPFAAAHG